MSKMYESLMEGLLEDLHDIQEYGDPQGKKTVIEYSPVNEYSAAEIKNNYSATAGLYSGSVGS